MSDRRPFLNMRSRVTLLTPLDLSDNLVKQFSAEYESNNNGLNEIIFPTDRLPTSRIISVNEKLDFHGIDLFSTDLFVWPNVVTKGQVTGYRARVRGTLFEGNMSLQIPADRAYTREEIREAFEPVTVDIQRSDFFFLLTPTEDTGFTISNGQNNFILDALDELNINPKNAIYASGVEGKISEDKTEFF